MKKYVYKLSQGKLTGELHIIFRKGEVENYYILSESDGFRFSLEELLERTIHYTFSKGSNGLEVNFYVSLNHHAKTEDILLLLPDLLSWHGYRIEEVRKITDRTLKSFSVIEDEDDFIENDSIEEAEYMLEEELMFEREFGAPDEKLVTKAVNNIIERLINLVNNPVEIVLKSLLESSWFNEQGIMEKVPAGYIAYNTKDGRVLVGGKFINVSKETLEKGDPWVLIPATQKQQTEVLARNALAKLLNKQKPTKDELYALFTLQAQRAKKEDLTIQDILGPQVAKKINLEEFNKVVKEHGLQTVEELRETKEATKKIESPSTEKSLDDYYVYDPVNGLLADVRTYLANKDKFSKDTVIVTDDIIKAKKQGLSPKIIEEFILQRLGLKKDSEHYRIYKEIIGEIINNPSFVSSRSLPEEDLEVLEDIMRQATSNPSLGIPLGVLTVNTGEIIQLSEPIRQALDITHYLKKQSKKNPYQKLDKTTLDGAERSLATALRIPTRFYTHGKSSRKEKLDYNFENLMERLKNKQEEESLTLIKSLFWSSPSGSGNEIIKDKLDELFDYLGIKKPKLMKYNFGETLPAKYLVELFKRAFNRGWGNIKGIQYQGGISFHPHQVQALLKMANPNSYRHSSETGEKVGMFFAHSTGTGKTFTGLAGYGALANLGMLKYKNTETGVEHDYRPMLVIAPEQILGNWKDDANTMYGWQVGEDIVVIDGTPKERLQKYQQLVALWAEAQVNRNVRLPKMILVKTSTYQVMRGQEYRDSYEGAIDKMDKYFLQLLSGPARIPRNTGKGTTYVEATGGLFGMAIVDEASMFFSDKSNRRKHLQDVIFSITSDENKGYAFFFNANAMANTPDDFLSILKMVHYNPKVLERAIGSFIVKTEDGSTLLREDALKATARYLDVVGWKHLPIKGISLKVNAPNVNEYPAKIDDNDTPASKDIKEKINQAFLRFANAIVYMHNQAKNKQEMFRGEAYSSTKARPWGANAETVYRKYIPGFVSLIMQAQAGSISWERLLEYGIVDFGTKGPFARVGEKGERTSASLKEIVLDSFVAVLLAGHEKTLNALGRSEILKEAVKAAKEYQNLKEEQPENKELLNKKKKEVEKLIFEKSMLGEVLKVGIESALTYGLSSAVIKDKNGNMVLRLPGYGWHDKPTEEQTMEGTVGGKPLGIGAFETAPEITGSERKLSIETRNAMIRLSMFLTPMLSTEKEIYYPVIDYVGDSSKPKIRLAKYNVDTGVRQVVDKNDKRASLFLLEDNTLNEHVIIDGVGIKDLTYRLVRNIDRGAYEATLYTEPFRHVLKAALVPFMSGSKVIKKSVIATPSRKFAESVDYFLHNIDKMPKKLKEELGITPKVEASIRESYTGLIAGDTTQAEREERVKRFNTSDSGIIAVTSAGGRGLNLPASQIAINAATFSREMLVQMLGRAFRIGGKQKGTVTSDINAPSLTREILDLKSFESDKIFDPSKLFEETEPILDPEEEEEYEELLREREMPFADKVVGALSNLVRNAGQLRLRVI